MKRSAFTLVEMLVVIGIIGILAATLMGTFSGGTESAHSARCLTNLRNLAAAWQSATLSASNGECIPAGSFEYHYKGAASKQREKQGWISWNSQGAYRNATAHKASASWNISMYNENDNVRIYCITNGALWKYVKRNHSCYICPSHERKMKDLRPNWSYVMNPFFGWDNSKGSKSFSTKWQKDDGDGNCKLRTLGDLTFKSGSKTISLSADKLLLFAEIPFVEHDGITVPTDTSGERCDCVLQFKGCTGCGSPESIGFNHKVGKQYYGHVAFADGHVEKLVFPKQGMGESQMQELTQWLCEGKDVSFDGKQYKEMDN